MKYKIVLMMILLILLVGCLHKTVLVKHPDAPMLVEDVRWGKVLVAIYDKESNSLVHYGWIKIPIGYTLHKYDWEKFIEDHQ